MRNWAVSSRVADTMDRTREQQRDLESLGQGGGAAVRFQASKARIFRPCSPQQKVLSSNISDGGKD